MHYVSYWKDRNHITFMGDRRMRAMFHEFVALVDNDSGDENIADDLHIFTRKSTLYSNQTQPFIGKMNEHYEQVPIGLYVVSYVL